MRRFLASVKRGDVIQDALRRMRALKDPSHEGKYVSAGLPFQKQTAAVGTAPDFQAARDETRSFVTSILNQSQIPWREVQNLDLPHRRIVIQPQYFATATAKLERHFPEPHWHVKNVTDSQVLIFQEFSDRRGRLSNPLDTAVGLESWQPAPDQPRPDGGVWPDASHVAPSQSGYNTLFVTFDDDSPQEFGPDVLIFSEPVDIVYTWVDSNDPRWRERRSRALGIHDEPLLPGAVDESRFSYSGELQFSLRSVFMYANWVRHIYLVTDQQVPRWLDLSHPKITVVDHKEILPGPVFNSHAIESALHRIPGLSEHYLYLNDDVFFGQLARPEDFFASPTISKFFPSDLPLDPRSANDTDPPIMAAAKNGRDLLRERFGPTVQFKIRHSVHPQQRSLVEQMEQDFPQEFANVARSLFRSSHDISVASSMAHWYGYIQGRTVPSPLNYLYLTLADPHIGQKLDALLSLKRYPTFCLNQEHDAKGTSKGLQEMRNFLPQYFPFPAPWEKHRN